MAKGFLSGDNVWVLIPLAALSIPIIAILDGSSWLPWLVIGLVMVGALTLSVRSVLGYQHRLRMEELGAKENLLRLEHDHLRSTERILELDETRGLRSQLIPPTEI